MNLAAKDKTDELFPLAAVVPGAVGFVFSNRPEARLASLFRITLGQKWLPFFKSAESRARTPGW
jgi:hypothetical protein